jgi:serine/threonine protein kinase
MQYAFTPPPDMPTIMRPTRRKIGDSFLIEEMFEYQIVDVKTGGMGCVYMLEQCDQTFGGVGRGRFARWLAVKTFQIAADDGESFAKELNIWIDLTVPYVVPLLSVSRIDGQLCAIMPMYTCSLDDVLASGAAISHLRATSLILAAARCLSQAYEEHGVLHLDLKPGNLLLNQADSAVVYVGDWGIARIVDRPLGILRKRKWRSTTALDTKLAAGTLPYMSPERIIGQKPDIRDDIYSLGLILCQLLSGNLPLRLDTEDGLVLSILNGCTQNAAYLLRGEPPKLTHMVCKCLARHRKDRYQQYDGFLQDLKKVQDGLI